MEYAMAIDGGPASISGGTGVLLLHPSTGETDRIDTEFFSTDTDAMLVISTRTTAREVTQKLEYYEVSAPTVAILDTLSVERGYSRRSGENIHYVSSPDDLDGILHCAETFLKSHQGKRRISVDSITELAYYTEDEDAVFGAMETLHSLLAEHDAVGLFHLSPEVHDAAIVSRYRELFDISVHLNDSGDIRVEYRD